MCHFCKPRKNLSVGSFVPAFPAVSFFDVPAPVAPVSVPAVSGISLVKVAPVVAPVLDEETLLNEVLLLDEEDETEDEEDEEETRECCDCGCELDEEDATEIASDIYCRDCCFHCDKCGRAHPNDTGERWIEDEEEMVCESCASRYYSECSKCGKWKDDSDLEDGFCGSCRENMGYCEGCNTWMEQHEVNYSERNDASYCDDCRPTDCDGDCTQGGQQFAINGVQQDTRFCLDMSDETAISRDGMEKIFQLINRAGFYSWRCEIQDMSRALVNKEGKFATRLAAVLTKHQKDVLDAKNCGNIKNVKVTVFRQKAVKQENGEVARNSWGGIQYETIEQEVNFLSEVGNLASQYAMKSETAWCSFTRDLNRGAGYFCNSGSCWFGSDDYSQSRCYWKHSGGLGFIQHESETSKMNVGRVWLMPVMIRKGWNGKPQLECTFDTIDCDGFLAINGYHENVCQATNHMVSLFAKFTGLDSIQKSIHSMSGLYINSDTAHLIAKPEILEQFAETSYFDVSGYEDCGCW